MKDIAHYPTEQPGRWGLSRIVTASREQTAGLKGIPLNSNCTSHVERNSANIRMFIKGSKRLTLRYSRKLDNLAAAAALSVAHQNYWWIPRELRITPAMAADIFDHVWTIDEFLGAI